MMRKGSEGNEGDLNGMESDIIVAEEEDVQ